MGGNLGFYSLSKKIPRHAGIYKTNLTIASSGNVLTGSSVTASSTAAGAAANTVDGNTTTYWYEGGTGGWLMWDMGSAKSFNRFGVYTHNIGDYLDRLGTLAGSNDNVSWTDFLTDTSTVITLDAWNYFTFSLQTWRYLRESFANPTHWVVVQEVSADTIVVYVDGLHTGMYARLIKYDYSQIDSQEVQDNSSRAVLSAGAASQLAMIQVYNTDNFQLLAQTPMQLISAGDVFTYSVH